MSLTVRGKVIRQCSQTTTFEETGEPKRKSCTSVLASSISRQWPATRPGSYTSSIHSMEELLHRYVACSKQSILHPSTLWKSYFTVTWHVQSNLYFIHPLYGGVTLLLRGMFKAIYTSSIHSMEELLHCYVACSKQSILHPSTLWKSHCYLQCYVAHSKQSLTVLNNCTCSSRSLL